MKNIVHNIDNTEFMKDIPINYYDLAIVDPEYGIDAGNMTMGKGAASKLKKSDWDKKPPDEKYFNELFRISKNQIIWGGNYFKLPITKSWIVWDKDKGKDVSFADGELAWTSIDINLKILKYRFDGFIGADKDCRIHKTQKPINLYKIILQNYAKPGYKIFDSHVGSGSIRIACHDMGFEFEGCELDKDYWQAQEERYQNHISQGDLFGTEEMQGLIFNG